MVDTDTDEYLMSSRHDEAAKKFRLIQKEKEERIIIKKVDPATSQR